MLRKRKRLTLVGSKRITTGGVFLLGLLWFLEYRKQNLHISRMGDAPYDGFSSLVRLSGINVPARARFVGEAFLLATLSSLTFGLTCGQLVFLRP